MGAWCGSTRCFKSAARKRKVATAASAELAAAGADQAEMIDDDGGAGAAGQEGSTVLRGKAAKESQRVALVKAGVQILEQ
jgi:hypothetical protein